MTPPEGADGIREIFGVVVAGVAAALTGFGRSHMKVRDRLQNAEVRLVSAEDKLDKLSETHESVVRLECSMLGLEDDMKNSIRRQERIQRTITSIERLFKLNGDNDND
jgi:hypothetical protein